MASFNQVIIIARLTRDPELRVTPKGTSVCQLGLAINESYKNQSGEKMETVTFVDVDSFGKQAEAISKHFTKGREILVVGKLRLDSWQSKEGEKRSKLKVILNNFQFVGGRQDGEDAPDNRKSSRETTPEAGPSGAGSQGIDEQDVPFTPDKGW